MAEQNGLIENPQTDFYSNRRALTQDTPLVNSGDGYSQEPLTLESLNRRLDDVVSVLRWDFHKTFSETDRRMCLCRLSLVWLIQLLLLIAVFGFCLYTFVSTLLPTIAQYENPPIKILATQESLPMSLPAFYACVLLPTDCAVPRIMMHAELRTSGNIVVDDMSVIEHNITIDSFYSGSVHLVCVVANPLQRSFLNASDNRAMIEFTHVTEERCLESFNVLLLMMRDHKSELKYQHHDPEPLSPTNLNKVLQTNMAGLSVDDWRFLNLGSLNVGMLKQYHYHYEKGKVSEKTEYEWTNAAFDQSDLHKRCWNDTEGSSWCFRGTNVLAAKSKILISYDQYHSLLWYSPVVAALAIFSGTAAIRKIVMMVTDQGVTKLQRRSLEEEDERKRASLRWFQGSVFQQRQQRDL